MEQGARGLSRGPAVWILRSYVHPDANGARYFWRGLVRWGQITCPSAPWDPAPPPNASPPAARCLGRRPRPPPSPPTAGASPKKKPDPEFQKKRRGKKNSNRGDRHAKFKWISLLANVSHFSLRSQPILPELRPIST